MQVLTFWKPWVRSTAWMFPRVSHHLESCPLSPLSIVKKTTARRHFCLTKSVAEFPLVVAHGARSAICLCGNFATGCAQAVSPTLSCSSCFHTEHVLSQVTCMLRFTSFALFWTVPLVLSLTACGTCAREASFYPCCASVLTSSCTACLLCLMLNHQLKWHQGYILNTNNQTFCNIELKVHNKHEQKKKICHIA